MKRKLICGLSILFVVNSAFSYSGGSGISDDPYLLSTKADVMQLSATASDHNLYFEMTQNIDMEGEAFTTSVFPAGSNGFRGSFDGGGFELYNFSVASTEYYYIGVFGRLNAGSISNLRVNITGGLSGSSYLGGLVGYSSGIITNCHVTGSVNGAGYTGGLVGYNAGTVTDCSYNGDVTCNGHYTGGLLGRNSDGVIAGCHSGGTVTQVSTGHYTGGLVGQSVGNSASYTDCYSEANVDGYVSVGGFIGEIDNEGSCSNCYARGEVTASENTVGGFAGRFRSEAIANNCIAYGDVTGGGAVIGGFAGYNTGSLENCCAAGNVTGTSDVGGFAGDNAGQISRCGATGNVFGSDGHVGGLVGENNYVLEKSFATGDVSSDYQGVGGAVGMNRGTMRECFATGYVYCWDDSVTYHVFERYVGGLCGGNVYGTVENCYAMGSEFGDNEVAGLIGHNVGYYGGNYYDVTNCYSVGAPSGNDDVGGSFGYWDSGNVADCFWDVTTSGKSNACGDVSSIGEGTRTITGMMTAQMKVQGNFANWDFAGDATDGEEDIWYMPADDYPKLFMCYDLNSDGVLDIDDMFELFEQWLEAGLGDISGPSGEPDGIVNIFDFAALSEAIEEW